MTYKQHAGTIGMAGAVLWIVASIMDDMLVPQPPSGSDALYITTRIIFLVANTGICIGLVGLLWGGAVRGRLGKFAVSLSVLGYILAIFGGILVLLTGNKNSFQPIGGLLVLVAVVPIGIIVAVEKRWSGWQRFMPLIHGTFLFSSTFLFVLLSTITANWKELLNLVLVIIPGVSWFFVGLAVYTAREVAAT